ncbi:hypothetical protein Pelo_6931 [Pelomyxa schiedti]|nr:hypothetical protein Pelo_6931 [Pelomyxa schiedti]
MLCVDAPEFVPRSAHNCVSPTSASLPSPMVATTLPLPTPTIMGPSPAVTILGHRHNHWTASSNSARNGPLIGASTSWTNNTMGESYLSLPLNPNATPVQPRTLRAQQPLEKLPDPLLCGYSADVSRSSQPPVILLRRPCSNPVSSDQKSNRNVPQVNTCSTMNTSYGRKDILTHVESPTLLRSLTPPQPQPAIRILPRNAPLTPQAVEPINHTAEKQKTPTTQKTLEEREAEYARARALIFGQE